MHRLLERQLRKLGIVGTPSPEQWAAFLDRADRVYTEADQDRYTLERALDLSSAEMRKRYGELRDAQRALLEASRKAGMADVAASVLHNIGNVLNSLNVSAKLLTDSVKRSARQGLGKTLTLLASQPKPGAYLDDDPRGRKLLPYLTVVDQKLAEEQTLALTELESLNKHIEHIKAIVNDQLAATRHKNQALVLERAPLDELVKDAIELSELRGRPGASLVCDLESLVVEVDRHKLTQIIVNLLRNAYDAVLTTGKEGTISISAHRDDAGRATVKIQDSGIGIPKELLPRIFNHGFTTKPNGNGYGLHHSACTAMELGGTLGCTSDGPGLGATFTLQFPRKKGVNQSACQRLSLPAAALEGNVR
jgi:two-component system NtrC family sensor kinase